MLPIVFFFLFWSQSSSTNEILSDMAWAIFTYVGVFGSQHYGLFPLSVSIIDSAKRLLPSDLECWSHLIRFFYPRAAWAIVRQEDRGLVVGKNIDACL